MSHLTGTERARYVQGMFSRIAGRYDLMNRLMTFGQDMHWRKLLLDKAQLPVQGKLLDLGSGTGDIAFAALERTPLSLCIAADFTEEMMRVGQLRPTGDQVCWAGNDALNLPYLANQFDAVTSGFMMRNVIDVNRALSEQYRVLKPGGWIVCLDTTPPAKNLLRPFISFHMHVVIPTLGKLLTGASDAYTYLPDTTEGFLSAEKLAERLTTVGFQKVGYQRLNFGTIALHWGQK
ncbi:MAG TPA: ubiquinone/menaquinone biosynthesis methyltransferase [Anaerolineales bacterium]|nr:ubiquinone/menaquinone biosynthesis methyltransferase [Anaerolineales bacterium]